MIKKYTPLAAIIAITILASIALFNGIDGVLTSTSMAIIGGLGGYSIATRKN